ncbi:MAG: glycosyltransferase family 9 protein [Lachnospiraceae bacterium]|nr:glycosyltransferase family 9 protein [Lachnospiraceae bacterium]
MENQKINYNISKNFLGLNQMLWRKSALQRIRSLFFVIDSAILLTLKKPKKKTGKKKVLIVYNMALGDGIMFYGVSQYLREIWPTEQYELTIACQKAFKDLYIARGIYDKVLPLDFTGATINLKKRRDLFRLLRSEYYDILLDPVGSEECTTNIFASRAACSDKKIGVVNRALPQQLSNKKRRSIYTDVIELEQENMHLIQYYAEIMKRLGANDCVASPASLPEIKPPVKLPEKFFIVFPVASMDVKKWDVKNYAYIAKKIQEETGLPLVICGTEHDRPSIEEMLSYIPDITYVDVIGKTNIIEFTSVIGKAEYVVTNDTSAYHIAVARGVKTFMVCGGYTYDRYAHYQYASLGYRDPYLITKHMDCYNCNNHCIYNDFKVFPCIERVTKEDAWDVISHVINEEQNV